MGRFKLIENGEIVAENDDRDLLTITAIARHLDTNMLPLMQGREIRRDGLHVRIKDSEDD